jgi:hypothetical protein
MSDVSTQDAAAVPTPAPATPIRDFSRRALTHAGVVWPDAPPEDGIYKLDLPEGDARTHFQREFLRVAFERAKIEPGVTLVARGGEFLDRMIEYVRINASGVIEHRLAKTVTGLDTKFVPFDPKELPKGATLERTAARNVSWAEVWVAFVARFVSDERAQRSLLVRVDGDGRTATEGDIADLLDLLDRSETAKDHPIVRKELNSRLGIAQERALELASIEGGRMQDGIYARLQKNLSRIRAYYDGLLTDLPTADVDGIDRIQGERRLKLTEELDNHRLRVQIEPYFVAIVDTPVREAQWRLALPNGDEARFSTRLSLADGTRAIPSLDIVLGLCAPLSGASSAPLSPAAPATPVTQPDATPDVQTETSADPEPENDDDPQGS